MKNMNLKGYCYVVDWRWGFFSVICVISFIRNTKIALNESQSCGRFSYIPLVLCSWSFKPSEIKKLQAKMLLIGEWCL